jgi:CrcB protein
MRAALLVMIGGAIGAAVRWSVHEVLPSDPGRFPWGTFVANVAGCVAIGLLARRVTRGSDAWAGLVVGGLGGLTTFSAFAVETRLLLADDRPDIAAVYVAATLVVGIGATELARPPGGRS